MHIGDWDMWCAAVDFVVLDASVLLLVLRTSVVGYANCT